jgi:hypothetical protein
MNFRPLVGEDQRRARRLMEYIIPRPQGSETARGSAARARPGPDAAARGQSRLIGGPRGGRRCRMNGQGHRSAYLGAERLARAVARCRHCRPRAASLPFVVAR